MKYVSDDIQFYPSRDYKTGTGDFTRIKKLIRTIPPPKPQPGKLIQAKQGSSGRANVPVGYKDYPANGFSIAYPANWQVGQPDPGSSLYMVPQGGAVKGQNGVELLNGAMIDYYVPQAGAASTNLETSTQEFLQSLGKGDPNLKADKPQRVQIGNKTALRTKLTTKTSVEQDPNQVVYLYTVARDAGLWYVAAAAQTSKVNELDPVFKQMIDTLQFVD